MLVLLKDIISDQIEHHTVTQDHIMFQVQSVWLKIQAEFSQVSACLVIWAL
jgi:hypothetical protein